MRIEVTVLTEGGVEDEDAQYCTLSVELDGCAGGPRCWPLQPNSLSQLSLPSPPLPGVGVGYPRASSPPECYAGHGG